MLAKYVSHALNGDMICTLFATASLKTVFFTLNYIEIKVKLSLYLCVFVDHWKFTCPATKSIQDANVNFQMLFNCSIDL